MPTPASNRMDAISEAIARLLRRQEAVERRLARIEETLGIAPPTPAESAPPVTQAAEAAPPAGPSPAYTVPPPEEKATPAAISAPAAHAAPSQALETRLGLTWINRIGVITLVLGVAFFFKYAIDNQWIGERERVLLGVIAGLLGLGWAEILQRRGHKVYAQGVCGAGAAILYLSFYACFGLYHLLPQAAVFLLMAFTTGIVGCLAMRYRSQVIAVLALAGGYATPWLLSTGEDRPLFFFSYVLLLNAGAVALARSKEWRGLETLAFLGTAFLYAAWYAGRYQPEKRYVATFYALVYYALFAVGALPWIALACQALVVVPLVAIWAPQLTCLGLMVLVAAAGLLLADRKIQPGLALVTFLAFWAGCAAWIEEFKEPGSTLAAFAYLTAAFLVFAAWAPLRALARPVALRPSDLVLMGLNGAVYYGLAYGLLDKDYHAALGALAFATGSLHLVIAGWLWRSRGEGDRRDWPALLSTGIAFAFLTLTIPIQFSGYRITMSWALEAAALAWIGGRRKDVRVRAASAAVFLLVLGRLFIADANLYPQPGGYMALLNLRFLTFAVGAACLFAAARWGVWRLERLCAYVCGHFVLFCALALEVIGWAGRTAAPENLRSVETASLSILMAAYALLLVVAGAGLGSRINRILGLLLIALVVLKLYVHDVWLLGRFYRFTAFAALGVLLLAASFVYSRYRARLESVGRDEVKPS